MVLGRPAKRAKLFPQSNLGGEKSDLMEIVINYTKRSDRVAGQRQTMIRKLRDTGTALSF